MSLGAHSANGQSLKLIALQATKRPSLSKDNFFVDEKKKHCPVSVIFFFHDSQELDANNALINRKRREKKNT